MERKGRPGQDSCMHAMCTQGVDGWDVDLPTILEANIITTTLAKVLWVFVYIAVYGLRPIIIKPKPIGGWRACASLHASTTLRALPFLACVCTAGGAPPQNFLNLWASVGFFVTPRALLSSPMSTGPQGIGAGLRAVRACGHGKLHVHRTFSSLLA